MSPALDRQPVRQQLSTAWYAADYTMASMIRSDGRIRVTQAFPHSDHVLERNFAGVPAADRRKMVADNAIRFFHLDSASHTTYQIAVGVASR